MEKVIEILNKDEKAKVLHTRFNELCDEKNITGAEYEAAKKTFLMMMIAGNAEAMSAMANEVYGELTR